MLPSPRPGTCQGIARQRMETLYARYAEATHRLRNGEAATATSPGCYMNAPDVRIGFSSVAEAMWRRVE
jgi:hypothetical protein